MPKKQLHETTIRALGGYGCYAVRPSCSCGWEGELHFEASAAFYSQIEAIQHETEGEKVSPRVEKTLDLLVQEVGRLMVKGR
jgi:hypothetical protein